MQPNKPAPAVLYYSIPGYPRPVFARFGAAFEASVYAVWGAVFVTIPPEMNATAAVEKALELAETAAADQQKFKRSVSAENQSEPP